MPQSKKDIISQLQKDILLWEGFKPPAPGSAAGVGLGVIEAAFPNGVFPVGVVHEFITASPEQSAATGGFISGILNTLMQKGGACVWISMGRTVFPPALKAFGISPEKIIFIDLQRERDVLWVAEEALKCEGIAGVIAQLPQISFTQSRRLQLAVETSKVTGFILRTDPRKLGATACVARWQITQLPSDPGDGLPGIGFPRWNVELLKVRNGNPATCQLQWQGGRFVQVTERVETEVKIYA